jgi:hypothetical protein
MNATPIRALMNQRHIAIERNEAVETASNTQEWDQEVWAHASRVWSRQSEALILAVVAEPPCNLEDVLSVLSCLAEVRNLHEDGADQSRFRDRDVQELTNVAIQNCVRALAAKVQPKHELPTSDVRDIEWSVDMTRRWLPEARAQ